MSIRVGVIGDGVMGVDDVDAQVTSCLAHRKPVLCEKPLASILAECRAVDDAQAALALPHPLVSVGFMRRFDPGYAELAASVCSGTVAAALIESMNDRGTTLAVKQP